MSFYTSLSGLRAAQTDMSVISHNIANVATNGFKKGDAEFADVMSSYVTQSPSQQVGSGAVVQGTRQQFGQGTLTQSSSALDLAITGDGFFAVKSDTPEAQVNFTRNGRFQVDADGFVVDPQANRLRGYALDADGQRTPITDLNAAIDFRIPPRSDDGTGELSGVAVDKAGVLTASYSDGTNKALGQVAITTFATPTGLKQVGNSYWNATGLSGAPRLGEAGQPGYGSLQSGMIEGSNVDITEELVGLIAAQRNFQANAKALDTASQISQSILNIRV